MSYAATVLADSIASGVRLTTLEVTFPRFILAEFNTHRMLSRNSASSRAIPVERRIEQVKFNPFVPEAFGKNKSGMQAAENVDERANELARGAWLQASAEACYAAERLALLGVHKQHANRVLEPFCWHTVVVTATEWANFFALRCHPAAQPEMQITAGLMRDAMKASTPRELQPGEWHLPYVWESLAHKVDECGHAEMLTATELAKISVARCAAVSYERQNVEKSIDEYVKRHDALLASGHMSPFEHQARVLVDDVARVSEFYGNFRAPWLQYRKTLPNEAVFTGGA